MLRDLWADASLSDLFRDLRTDDQDQPDDLILCAVELTRKHVDLALAHKEVDLIKVDRKARKSSLRWVNRGKTSRWITVPDFRDILELPTYHKTKGESLYIAKDETIFAGAGPEVLGVNAMDRMFIRSGMPISDFLRALVSKYESENTEDLLRSTMVAFSLVAFLGA